MECCRTGTKHVVALQDRQNMSSEANKKGVFAEIATSRTVSRVV